MPRLTLGEQTRLARLFVDRSCRSASARLKHSPLLKWRYGAPVADKLLIVPQDLRIADPSFASEVEFGHFGLGGTVAILDGASPFDVAPPNAAWERELHGFGWLRHLDAAGHIGARDLAIALVADWCSRFRRPAAGKVAWEPAVVGRRMMSWISSASLILEAVDQATFDTTTDRLGDQLLYLAATWAHAPEGLQRIEALAGLLVGHLSISGYERHLEPVGQAFAAELNKQILPDGGHVTRNPMALVELLLDFLPLRQCFITREQKLPEGFDDTIKRMLKMLRYLRLGDGKLGRFNGMSAHMIDVLSTVLAYDDRPQERLIAAPHSRYLRLERGPSRAADGCRPAAAARAVRRRPCRMPVVRDQRRFRGGLRELRCAAAGRAGVAIGGAGDREPQHALPWLQVVRETGAPRPSGDAGRRCADPLPR